MIFGFSVRLKEQEDNFTGGRGMPQLSMSIHNVPYFLNDLLI